MGQRFEISYMEPLQSLKWQQVTGRGLNESLEDGIERILCSVNGCSVFRISPSSVVESADVAPVGAGVQLYTDLYLHVCGCVCV